MPVVCGTSKALILSGKVFCLIKCQPSVVFSDGDPLLEGLDVRDDAAHGCGRHSSPSDTLTASTISRFCASDIPTEYNP